MKKTIFIGNGINLLSHGNPTWRSVLESLANFVDNNDIDLSNIEEKPFPYVFEEIYLRAARSKGVKEIVLKKYAAKLINNIPNNEYHLQILNSNLRHIITTNYDYNLEDSFSKQYKPTNMKRETKYSLFRRRIQNDKNIWYIHGEASYPNSLMLGHEHYAGALQKMRSYLTRNKKISPFMLGNHLFDNNGINYSWVDVFLRDDIYIVGYQMDYSEIDIWWLLSYKERKKLQGKSVGKTTYYQFQNNELDNRTRAKLSLLSSFGVIVQLVPIADDYRPGYDLILNEIL